MKILVTGATGFLGNHVINKLINQNCEIIATSIDSHELAAKLNWYNKVTYVQADLNNSNKDCFELFNNPDSLIHLSWEGLPNFGEMYHFERNLLSNYLFIKTMIELGLKNVLVSGTCFEYGIQEGCLVEDMVTIPSNPYGLAKDSLRKFLEELKKTTDFNFTWLRLFYLYGLGQSPNSLLSQLQMAIDKEDNEFNMSPGDQIRDFINVEEVADIISKLSLKKIDSGIVNCCSGNPISVTEFVEDYLNTAGYEMKLNLGYYPYSLFEPMAFWGDRSKLDSILRHC